MEVKALGAGLIHQTYQVSIAKSEAQYVLQTFSNQVFRKPEVVWQNYQLVAKHLLTQKFPLIIPEWLPTLQGKPFYQDEKGKLWRMQVFIPNSLAYEYAPSNSFLFAAAHAYGVFLKYLDGIKPNAFEETIPDFHNLAGRYGHLQAVIASKSARRENAESSIQSILKFYDELDLDFSALPIRTTHNDCKLSNVLFEEHTEKCIAVIDWDTLMPGYLVTDFGDMVRSMCASAPESEQDLTKVYFLLETYQTIEKTFLKATQGWITPKERERLFDGGLYIILEQAIRFLSDYLEGDPYYGEKYPQQNLHRAQNQIQLLRSMLKYKTSS